jgi:osmotically-inducible protein OsmY
MKDFFIGMLVGVVLTAFTGWYFAVGRKNPSIQRAQDAVATGIVKTVDAVEARIDAFELRGKDIKEDIAKTGRVVRRSVRSAGTSVADATRDTRITTAIKTKLVADRELSAWNIAVSTSDGIVTLSGHVATHDQIGRAMLIALDTGGVHEVVSNLRVKRPD